MSLLGICFEFAIPPDAATWAKRVDLVCATLEEVFPGENLLLASSYAKDGEPTQLTDRSKYLQAKLRTKTRWFNLSNGKGYSGYGLDFQDEGHLSVGGGIDRVGVTFPFGPLDLCESLLGRLGDVLQAHCAQWSPPDTFQWLRFAQWGHLVHGIEHPPHELPRLEYLRRAAPEQPELLG